ncbi:MAG: ABC transporter substrate-binding protein [Candidatus Cloacimonetes bacterium]|nr:ABC transporter substrate-binding protein [Candidatus Cloacimonadota bacterium]
MKRTLIIMIALISLLAIGCRNKQEILRFGVIKPSIDHLPYTWAMEKGLIDNTKYETVFFTSGWEVQEALTAGRIDAAIMPFTFVWNAVAKGYPVKTISFFERESDGILAQSHIRKPQDLEGKKVGILRASTLDVLWQDYAEKEGISAQPVYFRTPTEAVAALQNRDVDAIVIYVPIINKLTENKVAEGKRPNDMFHVLHWFGDRYPAHPCCDLVVNTQQIGQDKKKPLLALYQILAEAIDAMGDDQDSVRQFVRQYYGLTAAAADAALEHTVFRMGLEESGKLLQHEMAVFSCQSGYLDQIPSFADVYWDIGNR